LLAFFPEIVSVYRKSNKKVCQNKNRCRLLVQEYLSSRCPSCRPTTMFQSTEVVIIQWYKLSSWWKRHRFRQKLW